MSLLCAFTDKCLEKIRQSPRLTEGPQPRATLVARTTPLVGLLTGIVLSLGIRVGYAFTLDTAALQGDPAPSGGTFQTFTPDARTNNNGDVTFFATTSISKGVLFLKPAGEDIEVVAQNNDPAPGGFTFTRHFGPPAVDDAGTVVFAVRVSGLIPPPPVPGNFRSGIFRKPYGGAVQLVARMGDPAP